MLQPTFLFRNYFDRTLHLCSVSNDAGIYQLSWLTPAAYKQQVFPAVVS
jgi:hypothetical protein